MNKQFTFRGMEHSNIIQEYANTKFEKVERILEHEKEPIYIHITLTAKYTHHHHKVEIEITSPEYSLFASQEGPEFYDLISIVTERIHNQLTEAKRLLVDKRHTGANKRE